MWLNISLTLKSNRVDHIFVIFQGSTISFERSRRELSIDVAENRSTLKIHRKTHYPRFSFIPKT